MPYGDNMVWLVWQVGIIFVQQAVLTSKTGSFANLPAKFCGDILAHGALASLPGTDLGLYHSHQKFGLFVLIQFVFKIVIHLTSANELQKLRSSLRNLCRRTKTENLFIRRTRAEQLRDLFEHFRCGFCG